MGRHDAFGLAESTRRVAIAANCFDELAVGVVAISDLTN